MMALTAVLLCTSWQIRRTNPLRALIAGLVIVRLVCDLFSYQSSSPFGAIPQLAQVIATGAPGGDMAEMRAFDSECFITLSRSIPRSIT